MGNTLTDFLKIIYNENDYSRGLATSLSGIFSLLSYFIWNDTVITFLILIIFYPISRMTCFSILKKFNDKKEKKEILEFFKSFSTQEEYLIREFVSNGSSFIHMSYINKFQNEIESLINRNILKEVDNGYQLNINVFNKANEIYEDSALPF